MLSKLQPRNRQSSPGSPCVSLIDPQGIVMCENVFRPIRRPLWTPNRKEDKILLNIINEKSEKKLNRLNIDFIPLMRVALNPNEQHSISFEWKII